MFSDNTIYLLIIALILAIMFSFKIYKKYFMGENFADIEKNIDTLNSEIETGKMANIVDNEIDGLTDTNKNTLKREVIKKTTNELNKIQLQNRVSDELMRQLMTKEQREKELLKKIQMCKNNIEKINTEYAKCVEKKNSFEMISRMLSVEVQRERNLRNLQSSSMQVRQRAMKAVAQLNEMKDKLFQIAKKNDDVMKLFKGTEEIN